MVYFIWFIKLIAYHHNKNSHCMLYLLLLSSGIAHSPGYHAFYLWFAQKEDADCSTGHAGAQPAESLLSCSVRPSP